MTACLCVCACVRASVCARAHFFMADVDISDTALCVCIGGLECGYGGGRVEGQGQHVDIAAGVAVNLHSTLDFGGGGSASV